MTIEEMDITTLWAEMAVEELVRSGVTMFIITPGSRSTPLALAVARNTRAEIITHFDERGAGFVAVGYARGSHKPAALICTSGTAMANYLPAVVEASMDHLPLIVLSADRPPELQETGANQTIQQSGIFGSFVRWEQTMPCPTESIAPGFVLTTIDQAVYRAIGQNAGPVHLNFQFREPLAPDANKPAAREYRSGLARWMSNGRAYTTYAGSSAMISEADVADIAPEIASAQSGLLVVGRLKQTADQDRSVAELARQLGWPVVADIGSGLRLGQTVDNHIAYFDLALLGKATEMHCDCIVHLGGPLVSKRVAEFIASQKTEYIVVNNHPDRQDIGHSVTRRIVADIGAFASSLASHLGVIKGGHGKSMAARDMAITQLLEGEIDNGAFCELTVPRVVTREIGADSAIFLASSLTVRDFDMYAPCDGPRVPVGCNRGASGIDGTVASAVGFARGLNRPTTLVIGDTALLHDLNSLSLLRADDVPPITIVVVNNGGGAIFSMLPVADSPSAIARGGTLEQLFLQQHSFDFRSAAEMFGLVYLQPSDTAGFRKAYKDAIASGKPRLIELRFDWRESRRVRLDLRDKVRAILDKG